MTETLIIFIDGLPYNLLGRMPYLSSLSEKWPIRPGFGYSVNIHAELFAGLRPDDVGYFGEWMYNPAEAPGRRYRVLLPVLDRIFRPYFLNRGLQHLLTRRYQPGHRMPNIPLRHLDKFALEGHHILSKEFPRATLFSEFPKLHTLAYRGAGLVKGERDQQMVQQGMAAVDEHGTLLVPLPDLDGFGHLHGIDHQAYRDHMSALDGWCEQLSRKFRAAHSDGHCFIVSDHGMANVSQGVYLDIEERVGRASENSYLYFSDANLLRIWLFNQSLQQPIRQYLMQYGMGMLLDSAERQAYGLTSSRFGDFVYVLDEGLAFQPSTFARNIPNGMHGYHPEIASQQGIAVHDGPKWTGTIPRDMIDVHGMMRRALAGEW